MLANNSKKRARTAKESPSAKKSKKNKLTTLDTDIAALITSIQHNPDSLSGVIKTLFYTQKRSAIKKHIALFIKHNIHQIQTSKKENLILIVAKIALLNDPHYMHDTIWSPTVVNEAIQMILEADSSQVNHPDTNGYTVLYYAITHSLYIPPIDQKQLIFVLMQHGASIKPIEGALLQFFDPASPPEDSTSYRYTELWLAIVKEHILDKGDLRYRHTKGMVQLAIGILTEYARNTADALFRLFLTQHRDPDIIAALLARSIPFPKTYFIDFDKACNLLNTQDIAILKLLLDNKVVTLVDEAGHLNTILFNMLLRMDNALSHAIFTEQCCTAELQKTPAAQHLYRIAIRSDTQYSFLLELIYRYKSDDAITKPGNPHRLFIVFIEYFSQYFGCSFKSPVYSKLIQHLFYTALNYNDTTIIVYLKTKYPNLNINQAIKGTSVLFRAFRKQQKFEHADILMKTGAEFAQTEYMKLYHTEGRDEVEKEQSAILTFYNTWRAQKVSSYASTLCDMMPSILPPLVSIVADYAMPPAPTIRIELRDNPVFAKTAEQQEYAPYVSHGFKLSARSECLPE